MTSTRFIRTSLRCALIATVVFCATALPPFIAAETGAEAWLRDSALSPQTAKSYESLPGKIVLLSDRPVLSTARQELVRGIAQMLGRTLGPGDSSLPENTIVLGTLAELDALALGLNTPKELAADGYWLKSANIHGSECLVITAATDRGVLYGVFALLSKIAVGESITAIDEAQQPYAADSLGQSMGQPRRPHRTRIRRTIYILRRWKCPQRLDPRRPVRLVCWLPSESTGARLIM